MIKKIKRVIKWVSLIWDLPDDSRALYMVMIMSLLELEQQVNCSGNELNKSKIMDTARRLQSIINHYNNDIDTNTKIDLLEVSENIKRFSLTWNNEGRF